MTLDQAVARARAATDRAARAAKAIVAALGAVAAAVVPLLPDVPRWLAPILALATAAGVYATPNRAPTDS